MCIKYHKSWPYLCHTVHVVRRQIKSDPMTDHKLKHGLIIKCSLISRPSRSRSARCIASPARKRKGLATLARFSCSLRGMCIEPMGCEITCDIQFMDHRNTKTMQVARPFLLCAYPPLESSRPSQQLLWKGWHPDYGEGGVVNLQFMVMNYGSLGLIQYHLYLSENYYGSS